ncbi:MAG: TetR/AcrR family transcriptional regulator [Pseudomonadota bacterium]
MRKPTVAQKADNRALALEAARRLFIEDGYAAFSMRKVARAIGISQGHLQHFFPTREDLVSAMLEQTAHHYSEIYETLLVGMEGQGLARFEGVVHFLVQDITNREMTNFFIELWPMTAHNETASTMLRDIYQRNCEGFAQVVREVWPDAPEEDVQDMSLQILALIDGLIVYYHSARPDDAMLARVQRRTMGTIRQIAGLPPQQSR